MCRGPKSGCMAQYSHPKYGSMTTDREPTDREQTDRKQHRLAEKGNPKYIFTIPRAILPKPSLCDEITSTKSLTKSCNEIIASRSVCSRSVCRGQLTWLAKYVPGCACLNGHSILVAA